MSGQENKETRFTFTRLPSLSAPRGMITSAYFFVCHEIMIEETCEMAH